MANTIDPSHLRNFSALYLGSLLGSMPFTPNAWFVHLYLDGEYRGVYMLTDERDASEGRGNLRIDIDPTISEYMIEFDSRVRYGGTPVNTHWVQNRIGSFDIRYPSTGAWMNQQNNAHALYVEDFLTRVDGAIVSGDRTQIEAMIDIESFIDFYIVNELMANVDANFSSMFYQIRGLGEQRRLYAGPLWDFDQSSGGAASPANVAIRNLFDNPRTTGPVATRNDWFRRLLNESWFREEVRNRWLEVKDVEVAEMLNRIEYMAVTFEQDFQRDINRWPNHGNHTWNSQTVRNLDTAMENAEFLHWWLTERADWLTEWLYDVYIIQNQGWVREWNHWIFYRDDIRQTGWLWDAGSWFYLDSEGIMQTGWVHTGGSWFFMNNSGRMQTGWVYTGGSWFFMNNSGRMQTGWVHTGGSWFL